MAGTWEKKTIPGPGVTSEYAPCGSLVLSVRDDGPGFSPEQLKAVFSDEWQFKTNVLQKVEVFEM